MTALKSMVDEAISSSVEETWREDIQSKSSLKDINPNKVKVGQSHPVWSTVRNSVCDSRRAQMKCRLLTGTYTLQSNRAAFNKHAVDAICKLCRSAPETRQHFLVECQALSWLYWGLTSQSSIFQSCGDGATASWVINQYFRGVKCLAQGHNTAAVGFEPPTSRSGVRHSTTEPPRSPKGEST